MSYRETVVLIFFINLVLVQNWCGIFCADLISPKDLTKQLDEVTQNSEIIEIRQKEAECELEAARDRVQQQATEILLKASKTLTTCFSFCNCKSYTVTQIINPMLAVQTHQSYQLTHPFIFLRHHAR